VGDDDDSFEMHPKTGSLTTKVALDRESRPFYFLTASAEERIVNADGERPGEVVIRLTVEDVNDNAPQFVPGK